MERKSKIERNTKETQVEIELDLDGTGKADVTTGIPFLDHMLTLFTVHGFFDLTVKAKGDIEVDLHHTVEDVGLVLGEVLDAALGDRKGIKRYGYAITPMDEALGKVALDLSKRPFLVYNLPEAPGGDDNTFGPYLAREFFRAFSVKGGINLHINVDYGDNYHHIIESVFKSLGRALDEAVSFDDRIVGVRSSKGAL